MRIISSVIALAIVAGGGWYVWNHVPAARIFVEKNINQGGFSTLEVRYSADEIMASRKPELLGDGERTYLEPTLKFYPYILMEVKYTRRGKTEEGILLWSLEDGEIVTDAYTWDRSHGFEDCINAGANANDFRILNLIAQNGNSMRRDELLNRLHVDGNQADRWIESCRDKKLLVQNGSTYRLHFQNARLHVSPQTSLNQWLVTKPVKKAEKVGRRYSAHQIERIAQAAFGDDFTIRSTREVFLPVYGIMVQNPDGTIATTYWNALNGQPINRSYF